MTKEVCNSCGETKWGDKFPQTDSVCNCDEEKKLEGCGGIIFPADLIKCGEWSGGDQHFCKKCFDKHYPEHTQSSPKEVSEQ